MRMRALDGSAPTARRYLADLLGSKTVIYYLVLRDLKARYRYSHLGDLWALLQPFAMMVVLTAVTSFFAPIQSVVPYPLMAR